MVSVDEISIVTLMRTGAIVLLDSMEIIVITKLISVIQTHVLKTLNFALMAFYRLNVFAHR